MNLRSRALDLDPDQPLPPPPRAIGEAQVQRDPETGERLFDLQVSEPDLRNEVRLRLAMAAMQASSQQYAILPTAAAWVPTLTPNRLLWLVKEGAMAVVVTAPLISRPQTDVLPLSPYTVYTLQIYRSRPGLEAPAHTEVEQLEERFRETWYTRANGRGLDGSLIMLPVSSVAGIADTAIRAISAEAVDGGMRQLLGEAFEPALAAMAETASRINSAAAAWLDARRASDSRAAATRDHLDASALAFGAPRSLAARPTDDDLRFREELRTRDRVAEATAQFRAEMQTRARSVIEDILLAHCGKPLPIARRDVTNDLVALSAAGIQGTPVAATLMTAAQLRATVRLDVPTRSGDTPTPMTISFHLDQLALLRWPDRHARIGELAMRALRESTNRLCLAGDGYAARTTAAELARHAIAMPRLGHELRDVTVMLTWWDDEVAAYALSTPAGDMRIVLPRIDPADGGDPADRIHVVEGVIPSCVFVDGGCTSLCSTGSAASPYRSLTDALRQHAYGPLWLVTCHPDVPPAFYYRPATDVDPQGPLSPATHQQAAIMLQEIVRTPYLRAADSPFAARLRDYINNVFVATRVAIDPTFDTPPA